MKFIIELIPLWVFIGSILIVFSFTWIFKHYTDKRYYRKFATEDLVDDNRKLQSENHYLKLEKKRMEKELQNYRHRERGVRAILNMEE